jgi:hypothetical protein
MEPDTKKMFVNAKQLRAYCSEQQITLKETLKALEEDKAYLGLVKKRLAKGTKIPSGPVDTYVFDLDSHHFGSGALIETVKNAPDVDPRTQLSS